MASKKPQATAGSTVLRLPDKLNSAAAQELLADVSKLQGQPLRLNAGRVSVLGTQCLQILLAARNSWEAAGLSFEVVDMSENMRTALTGFGLGAEQIGAPEVRHGA